MPLDRHSYLGRKFPRQGNVVATQGVPLPGQALRQKRGVVGRTDAGLELTPAVSGWRVHRDRLPLHRVQAIRQVAAELRTLPRQCREPASQIVILHTAGGSREAFDGFLARRHQFVERFDYVGSATKEWHESVQYSALPREVPPG